MEFKINDRDKITMTHTGLLPGKSGKVIHVCFERKTDDRDDYAEIVLPSRNVVNSRGFDEENSPSSNSTSKNRRRTSSKMQNRSTMI